MKTKKLSKTQQIAWEHIRHAFPLSFSLTAGAAQRREDGLVYAGKNKNETMRALEAAGLVRVEKLGGAAMSDLVEVIAPVGERAATLEVEPANDVYKMARVFIRTANEQICAMQFGDVETIRAALVADGWTVDQK